MLPSSMNMFGSIIFQCVSLEEIALWGWDVCVRVGWVRWGRYSWQELYTVARRIPPLQLLNPIVSYTISPFW